MEKYINWELLAKCFAQECSPVEEQQIENWVSKSEENQNLYNELKNIWENSNEISELNFNKKKSWNTIQKQINSDVKKPKKQRLAIFKYAAAVIILLASGILLTQKFIENNSDKTVVTEHITVKNDCNKPQEVELPDGTKAFLNKNASIAYKENFKENRNLKLTGEAFFEVSKDKDHPFVINTENTITKVLGTSFNIKPNLNGLTEIAVFSGKVEFSSTNKDVGKILLIKDQMATYNHNKEEFNSSKITDKNILSWKTGILVFENDNLEYVTEVLSNHYKQNVTCSGRKISNISFTSTFKNEKLEDVLEIITQTLNLKIEKKEKQIILKTK